MGKEVIKSFKAFDKDMKCREFRVKEYAVAAAMIVALVIMCGLAEAVIR